MSVQTSDANTDKDLGICPYHIARSLTAHSFCLDYRISLILILVLKFSSFCNFVGFISSSLLASAYFGTFGESIFNFLNCFVWLRNTDEGPVSICVYGPYCYKMVYKSY